MLKLPCSVQPMHAFPVASSMGNVKPSRYCPHYRSGAGSIRCRVQHRSITMESAAGRKRGRWHYRTWSLFVFKNLAGTLQGSKCVVHSSSVASTRPIQAVGPNNVVPVATCYALHRVACSNEATEAVKDDLSIMHPPCQEILYR